MTARPTRLILLAARHAAAVRLLLLGLLLLSAAAIAFGHFSSDISRMLPDSSVSARTYRAVARSGMFNSVALLFLLPEGKTFAQSGLGPCLDRLAESLRNLPAVESVDFKIAGDFSGSMRELAIRIPQIFPVPDTDPETAARKVYRQMMTPAAFGRGEMLQLDPFGELADLLRNLERFREISGMSVSLKYPYLVAQDESAAMMLLQTSVSVADSAASAELLRSVEAVLHPLPEGVECKIISAHRRAVCNENVLRSDVKTVGITSVVLFALLFLLFYRCDLRSFLIPLIPILASTLVLAGMTLIFRETLLFIAGMGGIVVSLAVDYGIHTYAAMTGKGRFRRLLRLFPALCFGALTSVAGFALFLFSRTEGCRQLGFFAGGSLLLSLALTLLFLPAFLAGGRRIEHRFRAPRIAERRPGVVLGIWGAGIVLSLAALPFLKGNPDIRQFDVSPPEFAEEEALQSARFLSGKQPAILLIQENSRSALEQNMEKTVALLKEKTSIPLFSALDLWPSERKRNEHRDEWRRLRAEGGLEQMRKKLGQSPLGERFFEPFLKAVEEGVENPPAELPEFLAPVVRRLIDEKNGTVTAAVFFPDTPENLQTVTSLLPRAMIVSREGLAERMSADVMEGIVSIGLLAVGCVVLLTLLYFRSVGDALLALLPVMSSLAATGAVFAVTGLKINLAILIAAVILCGLAVDYGIFVLHEVKRRGSLGKDVFNAVTLSAVTSIAGGATVIFTRHPMLRDSGITLIAGITVAWLVGVFVIPAWSAFRGRGRRAGILLCAMAGTGVLCSCASDPFEYEMPEKIPLLPPPRFTQEASIVMEYPFFRIAALGVIRVDRNSGSIRAVALSPAGMKIFDVSGTEDALEAWELLPSERWNGREQQIARAILDDIAAVHLHNEPEPGAERSGGERETVWESSSGKWVFRDRVLREKTVFRKDGSKTRVRYYAYRNGIPSKVVLDNSKYGYRLILRAMERKFDP